MIEDFTLPKNQTANLISVVCSNFEFHKNEKESKSSLTELRELLRTLEIKTQDQFIQNKKALEPYCVLGKGKLMEIAEISKKQKVDLLIFDFELTATQLRNIKKITDMPVIDRVNVILEIFARHARTKEAKIQIEISRLNYLLPRLTALWSHLSRQKGGIGIRGGEGEQQIELDRRIVRKRILNLKKQLEGIKISREQQKKRRQNQAVTAALVGHTNVGKSSILNQLCRGQVLEEDKLFSTLDSCVSALNPDTRPPMLLIDTVGFISNLPNTLISGFKTTLESALEADLLIIVSDVSNEDVHKQLEVTLSVLEELGIKDKETIFVFNKKDLLENQHIAQIRMGSYKDSFLISTKDPQDIKNLREYIIDFFLQKQQKREFFVPYTDGRAHSQLTEKTNIIKRKNHKKGIFYSVKAPDFIFDNLNVAKYIID